MIKDHGRGDLQITWRNTNKEKVTLRKSYCSYLKEIGTCSLSERKKPSDAAMQIRLIAILENIICGDKFSVRDLQE